MLNKYGIYLSRDPIVSSEQFATRIENEFIKKSKGILHIGAHLGQEGKRYFQYGTKVLWVEAIPTVYEKLKVNIGGFPNQEALCALLGNEDNLMVDFNLASNGHASSSIFNFRSELGFNKLYMESKISLPMTRLDSLFNAETIANYDHWVVDVQGAELLVLEGAGNLLRHCKSLLVEVSTRKVYEGGSSWSELEKFLSVFELMPLWLPKDKSHENVLFLRTSDFYER